MDDDGVVSTALPLIQESRAVGEQKQKVVVPREDRVSVQCRQDAARRSGDRYQTD